MPCRLDGSYTAESLAKYTQIFLAGISSILYMTSLVYSLKLGLALSENESMCFYDNNMSHYFDLLYLKPLRYSKK